MQLYTLKSQVEKSIDKAKDLKKTIGLVPTMGSLSLFIKKSSPEL